VKTPRFVAMIAILLLGSLITGLAHIALLPPFEGFDETGHYAYIQQVAKTGRWPVRGDKMSKDIDDYLKAAPTTENMHGPLTYHGFFSASRDVVEGGRKFIHDRPATPRSYTPGHHGNWQAQHPPLYYYLMAPTYLASQGWSLATQLFFLRSLSYLIAWGGLCIVVVAMLRSFAPSSRIRYLIALGVTLWPAIFPMWFPEMGRLGNDSLIAALAACALISFWRLLSADDPRDHAFLGITLGLGLLTKATFLPLVAATFVLLAIRVYVARRDRDRLTQRVKGLLLSAAIVIAVAGWWYVTKFIETGSVIGSSDDVNVRAAGGILAGLKKLDLSTLLRSPWGLVESFMWGGTWSFVLPPRITLLPIVTMSALIAYGCFRHVRRDGFDAVDGLAVLTLTFFIAALLRHSVVLLASIGNPAPAWYLHSLAPILAVLVGYGIGNIAHIAWMRMLATAALICTPFFLAGVTLLNLLFFAGCAPVIPGRRYFGATDGMACLADFPRMYDNLAVLASPGIGLALFALGWSLLLAGMIATARYLPRLAHTSITSTR
jgi:4-amino-4-deoxy-L-arabinose transferase-like glycosyltransferase